MTFVINQNVNVKSKLLLLQSNFNWKVVVLRIQWKKYSKVSKKCWIYCFKPGLKIATLVITAGIVAKMKTPQACQVTSNILKSLTGGKNLSLTDMHGRCLTIKGF